MIASLVRRLMGLDKFEFDRVVLSKDAREQMVSFARRSLPREFSALCGGRIVKKTLTITHLVYQHFEASERAAVLHINVPTTTQIMGTAHSHPTPNTRPSAADRRFFNKYGYVNFIIGYPYTRETIACFDCYARPLPCTIL